MSDRKAQQPVDSTPLSLSSTISPSPVSLESALRTMIEAVPTAMLMVDESGVITLFNARAVSLFGYPRREFLGLPVESLSPPRFRAGRMRALRTFFRRPDAPFTGADLDLSGIRKDGVELPIQIGLKLLTTEQGRFALVSVSDITRRLRADGLLHAEQANALRQSILDTLPFSVMATNVDGRIISANPAAERLLGYDRQQLIGMSTISVYDPEELEERAKALSAQLETPVDANFEVLIASAQQLYGDEGEWTYLRRDAVRLPVNVSMAALRDEAGRINGFLQVAYDITQRKRTEAYIRHMAHHDALTGLPNRTLLLDRLDMAIRQAHRHGGKIAVLMLDLDHFKHVNDTLGHITGDRLLLAVSQRLQACVRDIDTVARMGGDEFVVVLTDAQAREEFTPIITRIVETLNQPVAIEESELMVTASVGGSLYPDDGGDAQELLKFADNAMYRAKSLGRSNYQWFSPTVLQQAKDHLALGGALRRAIDEGGLAVHYQPVICLKTGRVTGMEALARWQTAGATIDPERFIPVAEQTGLILPLCNWVMRTACRHGARLRHEIGAPLRLAVNVSPRQFQDRGWPLLVEAMLVESGFPPECLEIEITEGILMSNPEDSAEMLKALRKLGIGVVIDDFGTGFSSLSYLTRFPVDKIKIDRSFVRDLGSDPADEAIVDAVIAMAHSLKIKVVAEGVETAQQLRYLRDRGCDEAQGFYFGPAVPAKDFGLLITGLPELV